jgi:peptide/nickel transport system permease protein
MLRFIVRRVLWSIPVLIIASIIVFATVRAAVDPVAAAARNPRTTPEALAQYKKDLGLDQSPPQQYFKWLSSFVRGDFGESQYSNIDVWPQLRTALANTIVLGLLASIVAISIGVGIGIYSAVKQYSFFDHFTTALAFIGLSLPPFLAAIFVKLIAGKWWQDRFGEILLPTAGIYTPGQQGFDLVDRGRHLILPVIVVAIQLIAVYSRYMRTSMLETLNADYMRTARAKGVSERRVLMRHAFRNALIPLTTFAAIDVGSIAAGLIVTEYVFQYPGMGRFFLDSFANGDYMMILPWTMIVVGFVVIFNLLADLSYAWLDPRIRLD